MTGKEIFYDWFGGNITLFRAINGFQPGVAYEQAMVALSTIGDYHNFPYYFLALITMVVAVYLVKKAGHKGGTRHFLCSWFGALMVLAIGFLLEAGTVKMLKEHFSYPRPYIELQNVHVISDKADNSSDYHSMPSGHAAFITLMVIALWPVLPGFWALAAFLLAIGVLWSRISLGMHFPADVLAGALIPLLEIPILRAGLYKVFSRFGVKC